MRVPVPGHSGSVPRLDPCSFLSATHHLSPGEPRQGAELRAEGAELQAEGAGLR